MLSEAPNTIRPEASLPNNNKNCNPWEKQLNSFNSHERRCALVRLKKMADDGDITLSAPKREANLHYHSFFSFNANGWSPSRIAWEARKHGLEVAGIVDFDVLDGMQEFLEAGEILGQKTTVGLETRVFVKEYADKVINSPGEPGIAYFMAAACTHKPDAGSNAQATLHGLFATAQSRNRELMERVNDYLIDVRLDYERDVLPLTPAGNATERHLLAAYDKQARVVFADQKALVSFWAEKLGVDADVAVGIINDPVKLQEAIRGKLMKKGGVAYVQPDSGSFPTLESVIDFAKASGALPCATWLDGTSPGEENMDEMLDLMKSKGVVAANIIPDRNWNIKNPEEKALKLAKLGEMVKASRAHGMPLCVGTEMNKAGLPFVDDFSAPELQPYLQDFMDGAHFFWGHTLLSRYGDLGYYSPHIEDAFGQARKRKNKFYYLVGRLAISHPEKLAGLKDTDLDPEHLYVWLQEKLC